MAARGVLEADGGAADPALAVAAADIDGCVGTAACAAAVREDVPCLADEPTEKQQHHTDLKGNSGATHKFPVTVCCARVCCASQICA